jgi:hypothetical protein
MTNRYGMQAFVATLTLGLALIATAPAAAQESVDGRWMAFVGCWEPLEEAADQGILCVQPTDDGVEIFGVVDGEVTTSDMMVANGERVDTSIEGCEGWESSQFSHDGRRLFTHSEFVCGEEVSRSATGIMSLTSPTEWLDVRSVDVDGEQIAWVQRYRLVGPDRVAEAGIQDVSLGLGMAVRTARMAASRPIQIEDIEEAAGEVESKAVEAWVAARREGFDLDADELIRLADAGLPESIIDVVVAVSYPETFAIDDEAGGSMRGRPVRGVGTMDNTYGAGVRRGYAGRYGYGSRSFFWDPFYYGYSPYNSSYGYGYGSGYGSGYGYGYPSAGYYYTPVIITERPTGGSSSAGGRVVNGRGYTQGSGSGGARRTGDSSAAPSGSSGGGTAAGSTTKAPPPRKAKPRGGGG